MNEPRPGALCANFVLQATNVQGLGTRVLCYNYNIILYSYYVSNSLHKTCVPEYFTCCTKIVYTKMIYSLLSQCGIYISKLSFDCYFFATVKGEVKVSGSDSTRMYQFRDLLLQ